MGRLQHQNLPKLMQEGEKKIGQSFEAFAPLFPFEKSLLVGAVCRWEEDKCGAKKGLQTSNAATGPTVRHCHKLLLSCLALSPALHWPTLECGVLPPGGLLLLSALHPPICSNNDLLPVGQFVTDFFVLSISDNYEVL